MAQEIFTARLNLSLIRLFSLEIRIDLCILGPFSISLLYLFEVVFSTAYLRCSSLLNIGGDELKSVVYPNYTPKMFLASLLLNSS
jgi:hypothetical protein